MWGKHVLLWTSKIAKWLASKQFILAVQEQIRKEVVWNFHFLAVLLFNSKHKTYLWNPPIIHIPPFECMVFMSLIAVDWRSGVPLQSFCLGLLSHQPSKHESSHLATHLPIWIIQKCPRLSEASNLTFILKIGQQRTSPEDSRSFESHRSFQSPMFSLKASRLSRRWLQQWSWQFLVVPWATPWRYAWHIFWRKGATGIFKGWKVTTATKPFEELVESDTMVTCFQYFCCRGPLMLVEKPFNLEFGSWKFQPSSICCSPPDAAQRALTLLQDCWDQFWWDKYVSVLLAGSNSFCMRVCSKKHI